MTKLVAKNSAAILTERGIPILVLSHRCAKGSLRFITFGCRSAHVHKRGRKTGINQSIIITTTTITNATTISITTTTIRAVVAWMPLSGAKLARFQNKK